MRIILVYQSFLEATSVDFATDAQLACPANAVASSLPILFDCTADSATQPQSDFVSNVSATCLSSRAANSSISLISRQIISHSCHTGVIPWSLNHTSLLDPRSKSYSSGCLPTRKCLRHRVNSNCAHANVSHAILIFLPMCEQAPLCPPSPLAKKGR